MSIRVKDLSVFSGKRAILNKISLEIPAGSLQFILGPNGSGKSTLLKSCSGLLDFSMRWTGQVKVFDQEISEIEPLSLASTIHYVGSRVPVHFPVKVRNFLTLGAQGFRSIDNPERFESVTKRATLASLLPRSLLSLSAGELQRVNFCRALIFNPRILLLDEALSEVDIHHQVALMELIIEYCKRGNSAVIISHDLGFLERWIETGVLIAEGQFVDQGSAKNILSPTSLERVFPGYDKRSGTTLV
jgi:ABC-type cobalamin/Fe3+-siderophores transport system ATPase subunit